MVVTHNDIINAIAKAQGVALMYSRARVSTLKQGGTPSAEQNAAIIEIRAWIKLLQIAESQWEEGCITEDDTWQVIQSINKLAREVPCSVNRTYSRNSSAGGGNPPATGYVEAVLGLLVNNSNSRRPVINLYVDETTITGNGTQGNPLVAASGGDLSGTGTTNEIAYFTAAKVLASLSTATYPSLTELSYVKGVASAIQTQLNAKQSSLGFTPENIANKATNFGTLNNTLYPTTQAVSDLVASAVSGLLDLRGTYDASTNLFPATGGSGTAGAILKGDLWIIGVAGTLGGTPVIIGQSIFAKIDAPAQTAANWEILPVGIMSVTWGSITGNIEDQTDVGARKDAQGNVFIGGDNNGNTVTTSAGNVFFTSANSSNLTGSGNNYFGINANTHTLVDSGYNHFGDNTEGIILNTAIRNVFGNDVKNLNSVNTDFSYCNVIGGLDFSTVDFTNATQLFGRSNFWSINKILDTDLIEVTFDSNLPTESAGIYNTSTDVFTPYIAQAAPTFTPSSAITAFALTDCIYSKSGNYVSLSLFAGIEYDFSIGNGQVAIDLSGIAGLEFTTAKAFSTATFRYNNDIGSYISTAASNVITMNLFPPDANPTLTNTSDISLHINYLILS